MKHIAQALVCLLTAILCSCSGQEERSRELIQNEISGVERQVQEIDKGRLDMQKRLGIIRRDLFDIRVELDKSSARLSASKVFLSSLRELTIHGTGPSPGEWLIRNPAFSPTSVLALLLFVFILWLGWRFRQRDQERAMRAELDGVIKRLSEMQPVTERAEHQAGQEARMQMEEQTPTDVPGEQGSPPKDEQPLKPEPEKTASEVQAEEKQTPAKKAKKTTPAKKAAAKKKTGAARKKTKSASRAPAKKCKVKGCNGKHRSKGFCNKHYQQWRRGTLTEEIEQ